MIGIFIWLFSYLTCSAIVFIILKEKLHKTLKYIPEITFDKLSKLIFIVISLSNIGRSMLHNSILFLAKILTYINKTDSMKPTMKVVNNFLEIFLSTTIIRVVLEVSINGIVFYIIMYLLDIYYLRQETRLHNLK